MEYASIYQLNSYEHSEEAAKSRRVRDMIKAGRNFNGLMNSLQKKIQDSNHDFLRKYLNPNTIVVPVPSSNIYSEGNLWVPLEICKSLVGVGLAGEVVPCIKRIKKIRSSSSCKNADERPNVSEHLDTLKVSNLILGGADVILVDDILTLGRTSMACSIKLKEAFPGISVKLLALMRTRNIEGFVRSSYPEEGHITINESTGKTSISPLWGTSF